jgi:hypothetical protein
MMASGQAQNQAEVVMVDSESEDCEEPQTLGKGDSIIPILRELGELILVLVSPSINQLIFLQESLQEAVLRRECIILDANFVTDLGLCSVFDHLMVCFVRSKLTSRH